MLTKLKAMASKLREELALYRLVRKDKRTPKIAKIALGLAVGYTLLPFDLIPDWIPVLGQVDDLLIVPALVIIALKFVPNEVMEECRHKVAVNPTQSS